MSRIGVIVGGASGIGAASATALAARGLAIAVADANLAAAQAMAGSLKGAGHRAYQVDVASEEQVGQLFDKVEKEMGNVAVLLVTAAATGLQEGGLPTIGALTVENWDRTMAVNARGSFLCVREMLRRREAAPVEHGRIILISSRAAQSTSATTSASYVASKGAVLALIRPAATEAAKLGMTVNAIAPGVIDTPMLRSLIPPEQDKETFGSSIIGRVGTPDEVAYAVCFLASEEASFINGSCVDVNGGVFMR